MAEKKPELTELFTCIDENDASIGCAQCNVRQLPGDQNGFPVWHEKRYTNFTAEEIIDLTIDDVHSKERPKQSDCRGFDVGENFMPNGPDEERYEFETVRRWAELISELPENPAIRDAFHCWVEDVRSGDEQKIESIRLEDFYEQYRGTFPTFSDYVAQLTEDPAFMKGLDENHPLVRYFNIQRFAEDLEREMSVVASDFVGVHVFETS